MTEVKMWLNNSTEIALFSEFTKVIEFVRAGGNLTQAAPQEPKPTPEKAEQQIELELTREAEQAPLVDTPKVGEPIKYIEQKFDVDVAKGIELFKAYAQEKGLPAARTVLDKLGVRRASDITQAQIPALLEAMK